MMKNSIGKAFFIIAIFILSANSVIARTSKTINAGWSFKKGNIELSKLSGSEGWEQINLPHTWNLEDAYDDEKLYYRGWGTYVHNLNVSDLDDKNAFLYFRGANQVTEVYLNNQFVGKHEGGYTSFCFDISKYIDLSNEFNQLVVKVNNEHTHKIPPIDADFTFMGGIYRDVELVVTEKTHFDMENFGSKGVFVTLGEVSKTSGNFSIKSTLKGSTGTKAIMKVDMYSPNGELVKTLSKKVKFKTSGSEDVYFDNLEIKNPELWSPDSPNLYKVYAHIVDAETGIEQDRVRVNTGFRWIEFHPTEGASLNGEKIKIMGAARHQDFKNSATAISDDNRFLDVRLMKECGFNFLRISHYPHDPLILDLCDQIGLLTTVEIPNNSIIIPTQEYTDANCLMAKEMIRRDYNHPSIIAWATLNECMVDNVRKEFKQSRDEYHQSCYRLADELVNTMREEDSSRKMLIPMHFQFKAYKKAGLDTLFDVVGSNMYQGWYFGKAEEWGGKADKMHAAYPDKPMCLTEYGAGCDPRVRSLEPICQDFSVDYAFDMHASYIKQILERDFVNISMAWLLADFSAENRGDADTHINSKGLVSHDRTPKDVYWLYKANLSKEPFVAIASREWKSRKGLANENGSCTHPIYVCSNQAEVELFLNEVSLGKKHIKEGCAKFDVDFIDGRNTLRVIETKNNKLSDACTIDFELIPANLKKLKAGRAIHMNMGSKAYFKDADNHVEWIPGKEYSKGSFGYIAKEGMREVKNETRIKNSNIDWVYMNQLEGIDELRFDVSDGAYILELCFSELNDVDNNQTLVYNLGSDQKNYDPEKHVEFNVLINGEKQLSNANIMRDFGSFIPADYKFRLDIYGGKGIVVQLEALNGIPSIAGAILRKVN